MIFEARFDIIAFKPIDNEILDGVVYSVNKEGIEVHSGPIKCYIKVDVSLFLFYFLTFAKLIENVKLLL